MKVESWLRSGEAMKRFSGIGAATGDCFISFPCLRSALALPRLLARGVEHITAVYIKLSENSGIKATRADSWVSRCLMAFA